MSTKRSSSYTNANDTHLFHIYLGFSQNPIIGIYQSKDMLWTRVVNDYNNSRPSFITELRNKRSLQCRMQTILTSMGKMRGCIRQIERLKTSGASEANIRERLNDILKRKVECREAKIMIIDLNTITDPNKREFMNQQQLKIAAKRAQQQDKGSQNASGSFGDFFENLQGPGNGLPDY
ncbi:hypothetical protein Ddye_026171 [Dipteronia dyeriana]|uniref:Uncharacterized protein n=1 Tax=Dipteronia dyeriana TaxID=168575 RepID=A0AAD9TM80_9ROSI|nr:hypothetical protein Ddye_026167 [Dipteronia dyeriana]KAK2638376.1 hypothetical protein Ddye_026171 [Dipteronia dyeriana]